MSNLQLQRQAVSHKAILDFTVQRAPEFPASVTKRFPELQSMTESMEKQRIGLQLQLREQFVAIREMLDRVVTLDNLDTAKQAITTEIQNIQKKITIINQNVNLSIGNATQNTFGLVETDKTVTDPVVYLKATVDELLAALKLAVDNSVTTINQTIENIENTVDGLLVDEIPLLYLQNPGEDPNALGTIGKMGIFGPQRIVNLGDSNTWFWAGDVYKWLPG